MNNDNDGEQSPERKDDSGVEMSTSTTSSDTNNETEGYSIQESAVTNRAVTLPSKLDIKQIDWDELDELLQVHLNTVTLYKYTS